jgi:hypothetical protein
MTVPGLQFMVQLWYLGHKSDHGIAGSVCVHRRLAVMLLQSQLSRITRKCPLLVFAVMVVLAAYVQTPRSAANRMSTLWTRE